jgi:hypothetical protein
MDRLTSQEPRLCSSVVVNAVHGDSWGRLVDAHGSPRPHRSLAWLTDPTASREPSHRSEVENHLTQTSWRAWTAVAWIDPCGLPTLCMGRSPIAVISGRSVRASPFLTRWTLTGLSCVNAYTSSSETPKRRRASRLTSLIRS